jgi:iron complex outermembrane receptor protein
MKTVIRARLLCSTLLIGAGSFTAPAFAQTQPIESVTPADSTPPEDVGEDIVVTGSLFRNPNLVQSSPVNVVTESEIQLRQTFNAEQLLRGVPGVASNVGSSANNGNEGASFVDLRGLGANRNIVLLDGTRITPANLDGAVDLNVIPVALIERVDVLTGGASTTYGADAVSGVVNFITKRDFAGVDLQASQSITERGDGNSFRVDLTVGGNFGDDRGNAVFGVGYQESDPVYQAGDRPDSRATVDSFDGTAAGGSGTAVPARFSVPGVGNQNIDPATGNLVPVFASFNFNPYNLFQTPFKRYNMYGAAHYEVSDAVEVYTQGLFSKNKVQTIVAPSGAFSTPLLIPVSNPFLPAGARATFCANNDFDLATDGVQTLTPAQCAAAAVATDPNDPNYREFSTNVARRLAEAGGRISTYETTLFNYRVGARGNITDKVRYDVYGAYGESENTQAQTGYTLTSRFQQALRATSTTTCADPTGGCVPVNLFGTLGTISPAQAAYLQAAAFSSNKTSLAQVHGLVTTDLGTVFSGNAPISVAIGAEYRKYTADITADTLSQNPGELGGAGGAIVPVSGGYDVKEGFGEIIVPLLADVPFFHSLTVEAGGRYSSYKVDAAGSPSFNATTYKAAATWEPVDSLKIRANYQRAVRAPNIGELFNPSQVNLTNLKNDPCQGLAPTTNANLRAVCIAQGAPAINIGKIDPPSASQINATFSGNTNLRPEKADTFTVGGVFQPRFFRGFTLSLDYYRIKVRDAITAPRPADVISACFGNLTAASATSLACTSIRRDPATGGLDGDASTTPGLPSPTTNSGRLETSGLDLTADFQTDLGAFARLALNFTGNYTISSKFQSTPTGLNRECVGYYSVNCSLTGSILPEFSFNQRTTLSFGDVDVSLLWRHISSTKQEPFDAIEGNFGSNGPAFADFRKVDAYNWFDLATRFGVSENFDLTVTATNLFDKDPPLLGNNIGSTTFNSGNTFPSTYDALGRRFTVGARVKF